MSADLSFDLETNEGLSCKSAEFLVRRVEMCRQRFALTGKHGSPQGMFSSLVGWTKISLFSQMVAAGTPTTCVSTAGPSDRPGRFKVNLENSKTQKET